MNEMTIRDCLQEPSLRDDPYAANLSQRFEETLFTPKQGDALFWQGQRVYGDDPVQDPALIRLPFVGHRRAEGTDADAQRVGPFNG
jgi:hypothetical protein